MFQNFEITRFENMQYVFYLQFSSSHYLYCDFTFNSSFFLAYSPNLKYAYRVFDLYIMRTVYICALCMACHVLIRFKNVDIFLFLSNFQ